MRVRTLHRVYGGGARGCGLQVRLDRVRELVRELIRDVLGERVERVPEAALSDELECSSAHPVEDIDFLRAVVDARGDGVLELHGCI